MNIFENIIYKHEGSIAQITLNRPKKLNALNDQLMYELNDALELINLDETIHVLIIDGAGKSFCAGYDISPREKPLDTIQQWRDHAARTGRNVLMRLWNLRVPVITAVHGYALGGGCDIVLASDLTIMSEDTKIGEPDSKLVSSPSTMLLPWVIGIKNAKELILTGEIIDSKEAYRLGIANKVVKAEELNRETWSIAEKISKIPSISMELNKRMINYAYEVMGIHNAVMYGSELFTMLMKSPEAVEFYQEVAEKGLEEALAERDKTLNTNNERNKKS